MPVSKETQLLQTIADDISALKSKMPNGEFKSMARDMEELKTSYRDIKEDLSDIKYTLLNPEDGVIVKVNKVSEWRENKEKKAEEYEKALQDVRDLVQWKNGATKAMWIIFTAILGLSLNVFLL
jgi:hypothetical protein